MSEDKRKLKIRKPITSTLFNERTKEFTVELGSHITSEDVLIAITFQIETLADRLNVSKDSIYAELEIYRRSRKQQ